MKKLLLLILSSPFVILHSQAQWSSNPAVNNAICTATDGQSQPTLISDGAGGAIITWADARSGNADDIYAQCINSSGAVQWTANGVAVCTATYDQDHPTLVSDGAGGAIITWKDTRSGSTADIYAQRINSSGAVQWTANGVAVSTATGDQLYPTLISDGASGAIITWYDYRSGNYDIYALGINSSGAVQWTTNGVAVCTATGTQQSATLVSDGAGGAIITWLDYRSGNNFHIYAQGINSSGAVQWIANGVAVCTATGYQQSATLVSDGVGGAIITWEDYRNGTDYSIYAQRVNNSGAVQWTTNGEAVCTATGSQVTPTLVSDGSGGAIITWQDNRSGSADIYAQLINSSGAVQWTTNGVAICTATGSQQLPALVSDGADGAIITWYDNRSGPNNDIYSQRVNSSGAVQWTANGLAVCTASGDQGTPTLVSDGSGGAIITWQDYRIGNGGNYDIYAQNVCAEGNIGVCNTVGINEEESNRLIIYPNPTTTTLTIETPTAKGIYQLQDVTGKLLLSGSITAAKFSLDISTLSKGVYFLSLQTNEGRTTKKIEIVK